MGGVDGVIQALQADLTLCQLADQLDQVLERAPEAIQFPDHHGITRTHVGQQFVQFRTGAFRAAGDVLVDAFAPGLFQGIDL